MIFSFIEQDQIIEKQPLSTLEYYLLDPKFIGMYPVFVSLISTLLFYFIHPCHPSIPKYLALFISLVLCFLVYFGYKNFGLLYFNLMTIERNNNNVRISIKNGYTSKNE